MTGADTGGDTDPRTGDAHLGRTTWVIAGGWIPAESRAGATATTSNETVCLLNTGDRDARVHITVYFGDREPVGPYRLVVPARRTVHQRFNDLTDPEPVPRDTEYAAVVTSDLPVVAQHIRVDSRQACTALMATVAYPA